MVRKLGLREYPLYNARHFWAATMLREGAPIGLVQQQLGHASPMLTLSVYGRFIPSDADHDRWEAPIEHAMLQSILQSENSDIKKRARPAETDLASDYAAETSANSRGGTRTRDPGIMSAVL